MTAGAGARVSGHAHARTLTETYRRFAEVEVPAASALHARVALALSQSPEALEALQSLPTGKRGPALVLAALHDLALTGHAPALAAAHAAGDGDAAARAAVDALLVHTDTIVHSAMRRRVRADETGHGTVLYPALAEVAARAGATAVGLVDVGCSAGLNLGVDRVGITYGARLTLGNPSSPVQQAAALVGDRPVPARPLPDVVARIGVDRDPLDVTDADDVRWLRACLPPDQGVRRAQLDAELALAAAAPPALLRGDPLEVLPEALGRVPAGALPVVTTTWALSRIRPGRRGALLHVLERTAADRPVAWVSAEGVGVAPGMPTLGDRPASGHSIIGIAVFDGSARHAEAVGRCWSRGRLMAWLAD
ncbi:DUF2332 domain-containing protein [Blastococcus sp. PRF04-17]|uniref:DUF2332 domain-containing protein n=1 Tax=Blastococcus sp. PRF04-17 TaxID=2933797 RepID=UPI001FF6FC4D|nr:DUF2332 domain-containing protein [Blastococcus sp. PRF04-17]UOY02651.1 DUF2332 domain-containing protein [Blastococcus sp. PRF04-17]